MPPQTEPSPAPSPRPSLQVLITAGAEDPHRARQGLETALTAAAMGAEVTVFLNVRGAFWAERREHDACVIPGCDTIPQLFDELREAGVRLECCSSCARHFTMSCEGDGRTLVPGIVVSGLAAMVERTLGGTPTVTF